MIYSNDFLKKCSSLNLKPEFMRGEHLGRGFADLGFEQFLFLANDNLVSLYTGDKGNINQAEKDHFFLIPSSDYLSAFLEKEAFDVLSVNLIDRRAWELKLYSEKNSLEYVFKSKTLHEVFLDAALFAQEKINESI